MEIQELLEAGYVPTERRNVLLAWRKISLTLLFVLVLATPLYSAISAIDYGQHVDEPRILNSVADVVESETILPNWYNYPSMSFDIGVASFGTYGARFLLGNFNRYRNLGSQALITTVQHDLHQLAQTHQFRLYLRTIFVALTYLVLAWTTVLMLRWRRNAVFALIAAALLGGSWELNYHSRYIAPDALMMQFAALAITLMLFAQTTKSASRRLWIYRLAASIIGAATATKYQAVLLFLPLIYIVLQEKDLGTVFSRFRQSLLLALLAGIVFLIITPGALLQPVLFLRSVQYEIRHYQAGHNAQTVNRGFDHFQLILGYLGLAAFSKYPVIAACVSALAFIGGIAVIREDRRHAIILLAVPIGYILYMSLQRVMFIRNLMFLLPLVAILAARGVEFLWSWLARASTHKRLILTGLWVVIGGIWVINCAWLVLAAEQIRNPPVYDMSAETKAYLHNHADVRFFVSEKLNTILATDDEYPTANATREFDQAQRAIFYAGELAEKLALTERYIPINRFHYFDFVRPDSPGVNRNYFDLPPEEIVILDISQLNELGVTLS